MEILIKTLPFSNFNYGGILQGYALGRVLRSLGAAVAYDSESSRLASTRHYVRNVRRAVADRRPPSRGLRVVENAVAKSLTDFVVEHFELAPLESRLTSRIARSKLESYDLIVVGSDQVWRPSYAPVSRYLLDFAEDVPVRRIAYAASFGCDEIRSQPEQLRQRYRHLASRFESISVREDSAVDICRTEWGIDAQRMPDPTLLLHPDDYRDLARDEYGVPAGTMAALLLDDSDELRLIASQLAVDLTLRQAFFFPPKPTSLSAYRRNPSSFNLPSVAAWISTIASAEMVFTDSYHVAVFASILNKPFVTLGNQRRGNDRFDSLLRLLGLERQMVPGDGHFESEGLTDIDWALVNQRISTERVRGMDFLRGHVLPSTG